MEKCQKALGNVYLLDDIIKRGYDPLVYRLFNFSCHYKGKLNFTWEGMDSAAISLTRLREGYQKHLEGKVIIKNEIIEDLENRFHKAINDDLNMPLAMSVVWETVKYPEKSVQLAELLKKFDTVLGIKIEEKEKVEIPEEIQELIEQRKKSKRR